MDSKTKDGKDEKITYESYKVSKDGLPTGFVIKSEDKDGARRQLAIASQRLGFSMDNISLV